MMPTRIRSLFGVAMVALALGCKPTRTPEGLPSHPVCVAHDADMREVRCPASPDSYSGDRCTCLDADTRQAFVGRVQGGF
jgi:hypothetical protein